MKVFVTNLHITFEYFPGYLTNSFMILTALIFFQKHKKNYEFRWIRNNQSIYLKYKKRIGYRFFIGY